MPAPGNRHTLPFDQNALAQELHETSSRDKTPKGIKGDHPLRCQRWEDGVTNTSKEYASFKLKFVDPDFMGSGTNGPEVTVLLVFLSSALFTALTILFL